MIAIGVVLFIMGGNSFKSVYTIVGAGTIITAFFMGPLIDLFNEKFAKSFLNKAKM